jgi:hypothetical protein
MWVRDFNRARRRHSEVDVIARTWDELRAGSANCYSIAFFSFPQFVYPYTLVGLFRFRLFILPLHHPPDMRRDVQEIFRATPHHKQVMMFSATLAKDIRVTCKKFMANVCGSSGRQILPSNISYSRSRFLSMMRQS